MPAQPFVTNDEVTGSGLWPAFANLPPAGQTMLVLAASNAIERNLLYSISQGTYDELSLPGLTKRLYARSAAPLTAVNVIEYGREGSRVAITDYDILGDGWSGVIRLHQAFLRGFEYPNTLYGGDPRYGEVHLNYEAGVSTADVPSDLKLGCILAAKAMRDLVPLGPLVQEKLGDYQAWTPLSGASALPESVKSLIAPWRRKRFS